MTVYAITDTKKGEQGLRLLIFKLFIGSNSMLGHLVFFFHFLSFSTYCYFVTFYFLNITSHWQPLARYSFCLPVFLCDFATRSLKLN